MAAISEHSEYFFKFTNNISIFDKLKMADFGLFGETHGYGLG
jgi:hypothetical protein